MWANTATLLAKKIVERNRKAALQAQYTVAGVTLLADIAYLDDGNSEHTLDICYPKEMTTHLPVLINIHGGGFFMESKGYQYRRYGMNLAKKGFVVLNINYRLAPKAIFPSQIEDVLAVLSFVVKQQQEYFFDAKQIFLVGDSAGAYLAAMVACINQNPSLQKIYHCKQTYAIKAIGVNCGFYDFDSLLSKDISFPMRKEMLQIAFGKKKYQEHPLYPYTSILTNMTNAFVPTYVMDTKYHSFVNESKRLVMALQAHQIETKYHFIETRERLGHVFHVVKSIEECRLAKQVMEEMTNFFKEHSAL